ncbi:hypothetical protein V8C86DRAFT_2726166 [Haematococcus lacustris]
MVLPTGVCCAPPWHWLVLVLLGQTSRSLRQQARQGGQASQTRGRHNKCQLFICPSPQAATSVRWRSNEQAHQCTSLLPPATLESAPIRVSSVSLASAHGFQRL